MSISALASAIEFLAECDVAAIRLHAARTLGCPRKFAPIGNLGSEAERDMFARDVRELFLLPYVEALRTGRLRGLASGVLGNVLSSNASVALDALLARGCLVPGPALDYLLEDMLARAHPRGFFYEPYQLAVTHEPPSARNDLQFVAVTAAYARYLLAFGKGRDPRIRPAFEWLASLQSPDGTWRSPYSSDLSTGTDGYLQTRIVALAFAEMPAQMARRFAATRRKLASAWSDRILETCESPDAVLTEVNFRETEGPVPDALRDRILYFPLEDLWLAVAIGASPNHPHLAPWIEWLHDTQLADGSWRLGNPGLRERLLLSDPNGRLRAEALFLTDEWITLRGAQILHLAHKRARARSRVVERVAS